MNETFADIDAYFTGGLSPEQKKEFEQRIQSEPTLAEDIAFYITARAGIRNELIANKTKEWTATGETEREQEETETIIARVVPIKRGEWKKWLSYAAAAVIILFFSVYFFETKDTAKRLADNYLKQNYTTLSLTMGAEKDSIQTGIFLYKEKKYEDAVKYFHQLYINHPDNSELKKNEGLSYLQAGKYDEAIQSFSDLAAMKNLVSNPGHILQAIALIKRNQPGDRAQAKQLLNTVVSNVNHNEEGSQDAEKWLQEIK